MLVAADIYRPAAIDQLESLGEKIDVPVYSDRETSDVSKIARDAMEAAKKAGLRTVILDTAGPHGKEAHNQTQAGNAKPTGALASSNRHMPLSMR